MPEQVMAQPLMEERSPFALQQALDERAGQGLLRQRQRLASPQGARIQLGEREYLNFSSNDYLGAATAPEIIAAWQVGVARWGAGSGSSPLVTGYTDAHAALEEALASWLGVEAVLLFSTGFAANQALLKALLDEKHALWQDRLNHASLQEAGALSPARMRRFRHNDMAHLQSLLDDGKGLIVSEGVFSMDGDEAPCAELLALSRGSGNWLMLDDAHGFGVHGTQGRGTLDKQGLDPASVDIVVGTFGKAFGTAGSFVAGSRQLVDYLINFARDYVYSTHMPAAQAHATLVALGWVQQADAERQHLQRLIGQFQRGAAELGLALMPSQTAIQPLLVGKSDEALLMASRLREMGCWVTAIRPPTVPAGSARLRITLSAAHTLSDVDQLLSALAHAGSVKGGTDG
ncbi:MAG: 8-amino-7-oxononanoate synthase [Aeromonadaceae bacterium]